MQVLTNKGFRIIFFTYCCLTEQRAKVADFKSNARETWCVILVSES